MMLTLTCSNPECAREFTRPQAHSTSRTPACSRACREVCRRAGILLRLPKQTYTCPVCLEPFQRYQSNVVSSEPVCSVDCRREQAREKARKGRAAGPSVLVPLRVPDLEDQPLGYLTIFTHPTDREAPPALEREWPAPPPGTPA